MNHLISTQAIFDAIGFYKEKGYIPHKVPLLVDASVSNMTKPRNVPNLHHNDTKVYVASAEQSFLQLLEHGVIYEDDHLSFQGLTPCYRHERFLDEEHYSIFLKLELFSVGKVLDRILSSANDFFISQGLDTKIVATLEGYDILCKYTDIELGSYGIRKNNANVVYTYGTGIAEPRFTHCLEMQHTFAYKNAFVDKEI